MSAARYRLNPERRAVTLSLGPGETLLVARAHRAGMWVDENREAEDFSVAGITSSDVHGEIRMGGGKLRKAFVPESKRVYTLAYR